MITPKVKISNPFFLSFASSLIAYVMSAQVQVRREMNLMHSPSSVVVVASDSATANLRIDEVVAEFQRIEDLISEWNPNSEISAINRNAGIQPIRVSKEVFDFIERSLVISEITDGAFDLSWASLRNLWKFDGSPQQMPTESEVKESVQFIGYQNIQLDKAQQTVFLKEKGMKLGTGGNGQGFGVDKSIELLKKKGVKGALVNASGDIYAYGKQADGTAWKVGVSNPLDKTKVFALLDLEEMALTTAGNYEKFIEYKGEKYSHIIDPRTGYPALGVQSVSVYSKSAELSDALDTALFILGPQNALYLVEQIPEVECVIVDKNNKIFYSHGIKKEFEE